MVTTRTLLLPVDKKDEAEIEVWAQADRVWIRVSPKTHATDKDAQNWTLPIDTPDLKRLELGVTARRVIARYSESGHRLGLFERMRLFAREVGMSGLEIHPGPDAPASDSPQASDNEQPASDTIDLFGLSDAEWLQAEALALQKQAVERATSLDQTLAYVTEKCAAVREP
jgi:hypothetical protein